MTKIYLRSGQSATWLRGKFGIFICAAMLLGALFFAPASGAATAVITDARAPKEYRQRRGL
jgi:hypothetical protein